MRFARFLALTAFAGCWLVGSCWSVADVIWTGDTAKNPIQTGSVNFVQVKGDTLVYSIAGAAPQSKPLAQVQQMQVDGEQSFNDAEQAYRNGKLADAVDPYLKALRATDKQFIKDRITSRLGDLAAKSNRFDAAALVYINQVLADPTSAGKSKPAAPAAPSPYLDSALQDTNAALANPKLTDAQKAPLLGFSLDLYRAKNDTTSAQQIVQQLAKLGAASSSDLGMLKLASAKAALDAQDYPKALDLIQQNRAMFTDPSQQVEALYTIAAAKDGTDGSKDDPDTLKDLALAYIRAAAFGKDVSGQPHVAQSLFRVAQIEESLKDTKAALGLYQQIAKDYAGQPVAADAKTAVDRMSKGTSP